MSSNSVKSETFRSGFTRFAVVAAEIPAPPPPITMSRSVMRRPPQGPLVGTAVVESPSPDARRQPRRAIGALAVEQRGDRLAPAPARRLGHRLAEHVADVGHDPRLRGGQVQPDRARGRALADGVAGIDGDAPREQRDHDLLGSRAGAADVARAREAALGAHDELDAVDRVERLLEVGEGRADRALRAVEVRAVVERGEGAALGYRFRVSPRQPEVELQTAAHQRARAGEEADPRAG